jgi:hypothetical protein
LIAGFSANGSFTNLKRLTFFAMVYFASSSAVVNPFSACTNYSYNLDGFRLTAVKADDTVKGFAKDAKSFKAAALVFGELIALKENDWLNF